MQHEDDGYCGDGYCNDGGVYVGAACQWPVHLCLLCTRPRWQIIMLTRLKEGSSTKCDDYTGGFLGPDPSEGPATVGDVEVTATFLHTLIGIHR